MTDSKAQQEIIEYAVSSFIKNNDVVGRQYLKLRQDALDVYQKIAEQVEHNGKASPELLLQLRKLEVDASRVSISYNNYLSRASETIKYAETHHPQYVLKLEKQYIELTERKEQNAAKIKALQEDSTPVVEKMNRLTGAFRRGMLHKTLPGGRGRTDVLTRSQGNPSPDSTYINYSSTVFDKSTLENMFGDIEQKLREVRNVDDLDSDTTKLAEGQSIDFSRHLDELVRKRRAFRRTHTQDYSYDLTWSSVTNLGTKCNNLDDYDRAIENVTNEIRGLVEGGALAKESWMANARKLEAIQTVLQSLEDIEMEEI